MRPGLSSPAKPGIVATTIAATTTAVAAVATSAIVLSLLVATAADYDFKIKGCRDCTGWRSCGHVQIDQTSRLDCSVLAVSRSDLSRFISLTKGGSGNLQNPHLSISLEHEGYNLVVSWRIRDYDSRALLSRPLIMKVLYMPLDNPNHETTYYIFNVTSQNAQAIKSEPRNFSFAFEWETFADKSRYAVSLHLPPHILPAARAEIYSSVKPDSSPVDVNCTHKWMSFIFLVMQEHEPKLQLCFTTAPPHLNLGRKYLVHHFTWEQYQNTSQQLYDSLTKKVEVAKKNTSEFVCLPDVLGTNGSHVLSVRPKAPCTCGGTKLQCQITSLFFIAQQAFLNSSTRLEELSPEESEWWNSRLTSTSYFLFAMSLFLIVYNFLTKKAFSTKGKLLPKAA